jgi:hypothetical protein
MAFSDWVPGWWAWQVWYARYSNIRDDQPVTEILMVEFELMRS